MRTKLDQQAKDQFKSLEYWFRQKYKLPPTDPRFLAMDDRSLYLEFRLSEEHADFIKSLEDEDPAGEYQEDFGPDMPLQPGWDRDEFRGKTKYNPEDIERMFAKSDEEGIPFEEVLRNYG